MQRIERISGHLQGSLHSKQHRPAPSNNSNTSSALREEKCGGSGKRFEYSADPIDPANPVLTLEQRQFYEENGFLLIKNLIPKREIDIYTNHFIDVCNGKAELAPGTLMMRDIAVAKKKEMGERAITKLQDWQNDPVLFSYCQYPEVVKYVSAFIGPNVASAHTMLINKPPDVGLGSSRHPPHQDLFYFPFRPANKIVCSWTAMQKIDRANGCLFVKPGSHKGELLAHGYPDDGVVNKAYHGIQGMSTVDLESYLHVEMDVGDTIFFHPILIHGSGPNLSENFRKAISCHYASADCFFVPTDGTVQELAAKEVEEIAKKKTGMDISFADIWRLKSRLVAGKPGTFIDAPSF